MNSSDHADPKVVYWHRELPPLDGEPMDEHVVEADSKHVHGTIEQHGELWHRCYASIMENVRVRVEQEIHRLDGDYAHVLDEFIETHRNDATGESWLHGRFNYMLYRKTDAR